MAEDRSLRSRYRTVVCKARSEFHSSRFAADGTYPGHVASSASSSNLTFGFGDGVN